MSGEADLDARREPIEVHYGAVVGVGLGTALFLAVSLAGLYWYFARNADLAEVQAPTRFPAPRLQSDPAVDLQAMQAAQRGQTDAYGWEDRERGIVRIPVARAMEILGQRGADAWTPLEAPDPAQPFPVRPEAARR